MTRIIPLILILIIILAGCDLIGCGPKPANIIFTTGLNEYNYPIDNLKNISINSGKLYIHVTWNLEIGTEYNYQCRIFDGSKSSNPIYENQIKFTPMEKTWYTWTWYFIRPKVHKPGEWRFEIYLDDKKAAVEYLTVKAE